LLRRLWLSPLLAEPIPEGASIMRFQPTAETLAIVARLGGHWNGRYALVPCPAHEDHAQPVDPARAAFDPRPLLCRMRWRGCHAGHPHVLGHPVGSEQAGACQ
jgi:hypothetical protein